MSPRTNNTADYFPNLGVSVVNEQSVKKNNVSNAYPHFPTCFDIDQGHAQTSSS